MEDVTRRRGWFWRWGPVALWAAAIFIASSIPSNSMPSASMWRFDKTIHAFVFGVFAFLLVRALGRFWPAVSLAAVWGALDEVHQKLTPGRSADVRDFVADVAGALAGAFLAMLVARFVAQRQARKDPADGAPTQVP